MQPLYACVSPIYNKFFETDHTGRYPLPEKFSVWTLYNDTIANPPTVSGWSASLQENISTIPLIICANIHNATMASSLSNRYKLMIISGIAFMSTAFIPLLSLIETVGRLVLALFSGLFLLTLYLMAIYVEESHFLQHAFPLFVCSGCTTFYSLRFGYDAMTQTKVLLPAQEIAAIIHASFPYQPPSPPLRGRDSMIPQ